MACRAAVYEVDDLHLDCRIHPGLPVISAALALAEREGANGRKLIEAMAKRESLDADAVEQKFRNLLQDKLSPEKADRIVRALDAHDDGPDVRTLTPLLTTD
jgi:2-methylcitrate dehydratase PrpD